MLLAALRYASGLLPRELSTGHSYDHACKIHLITRTRTRYESVLEVLLVTILVVRSGLKMLG